MVIQWWKTVVVLQKNVKNILDNSKILINLRILLLQMKERQWNYFNKLLMKWKKNKDK